MNAENKAFHYIRWFEDLRATDVALVGGKNASLGEMIRTLKPEGIRIPDGFATTAEAYRRFVEDNQLANRIRGHLEDLKQQRIRLDEAGHAIRNLFLNARFPEDIAVEIRQAYHELSRRYGVENVDVAVRSSATAEDLPEASFAGQQETYLNVVGETALIQACQKCLASLFTDRAISYREGQRFEHMRVALSIGIQKMVRADKAGAGVMFSIDTESGFPHTVLINAAWGLGENVVKGTITPDEYMVFKPLLEDRSLTPIIEKTVGSKAMTMVYAAEGQGETRNTETPPERQQAIVLTDDEILRLARWATRIERHYNKPMDMEWAKDGISDELYIVQARPETVQSRKKTKALKSYVLKEKGQRLARGLSIGEAIATGKVRIIRSSKEMDQFRDGEILVTEMTEPDWVPVIRRAAGIITNSGGRTCHAAIVSREFGIPAIVGTGNATEVLQNGQEITLSCAEGEHGYIYEGILPYEELEEDIAQLPETRTTVMINIASPAAALRWWPLPVGGIGLARMEFIINNIIKIHPMALLRFNDLQDEEVRRQIQTLTQRYSDKTEYFVDNLAQGIAKIAASRYPDPVIVRTSDFKTNEYAALIGGNAFEPKEANPMIGFRGASRYYSPRYQEGFALECRALKRVREEIGMTNVVVMIPFCRTLEEADRVLAVMVQNGLKRGENGLEIYIMCEIPSNVVLADEFSKRFDGFSIGSNDLTQLSLGIDRDSAELAYLFDERNETITRMITQLIRTAHQAGRKVGICGQAPSDYPEFADFLVGEGIDSISLNPDSVIRTKKRIAEKERALAEEQRSIKLARTVQPSESDFREFP